MSWAKQSADAGMARLHEWEAVRGMMGAKVEVDVPNVEFIKVYLNELNVDVHSTVYQMNFMSKMSEICIYKVHFNLGAGRR